MNDRITEVWMRVPDTPYIYLVSNHGRLLRVSECMMKIPGDGNVPIIHDETAKLWCSFRGCKLGWFIFVDPDNERFYERDELMRLFSGIPVQVDTSRDAEAVARREHLILNCEARIATEREEHVAEDYV